jgi:hypothetical protein
LERSGNDWATDLGSSAHSCPTFGWDALVAIGTLALAAGTVGLAVATVVTAKQTRELVASTERATAVGVVIGLFGEFRTMSPARYRLGPELAKFDSDVPLRDLPESVRVDAFNLARFELSDFPDGWRSTERDSLTASPSVGRRLMPSSELGYLCAFARPVDDSHCRR